MFTLWMPKEEPSKLPLHATHQVGVGGLVLNSANKVLLVQERVADHKLQYGMWKLPGGLVDPGEDLVVAAAREV